MEELNICPSTLAEGFNTYSPMALRLLFDGRVVSHVLTFDIKEFLAYKQGRR